MNGNYRNNIEFMYAIVINIILVSILILINYFRKNIKIIDKYYDIFMIIMILLFGICLISFVFLRGNKK